MISIILPTHKNAPYLARAIDSVRAQTRSDWELLIIDDGLFSHEMVDRYIAQDSRIICIRNERNLGIQVSLNRGIEKAKGEYVARIDDDDEWVDTEKLEKQVTFLEHNPGHVLVGTNAVLVDERGKMIGAYRLPETDTSIRARILSKNCFLHPTVMMRKDVVQEVKGYSQSSQTTHVEDYILWLALGKKGKFANLPDTTTALMVHPGSLTFQNRVVQAIRMRTIARLYKDTYPRFLLGQILLTMRIIGFWIIRIIPIPKRLLYLIQKIYKEY